jgi:hypothetical protein
VNSRNLVAIWSSSASSMAKALKATCAT